MNCPKCRRPTAMMPGKAMRSTVTGIGDFHDADTVVTLSAGGPGTLIDCLKCPTCGYSVEDRNDG
jgi:hypothetical protein